MTKTGEENYVLISLMQKQSFNQTQYPFIKKVPKRLWIQGKYFTMIKVIFSKPIVNINIKKNESQNISLKLEKDACTLSAYLILYLSLSKSNKINARDQGDKQERKK